MRAKNLIYAVTALLLTLALLAGCAPRPTPTPIPPTATPVPPTATSIPPTPTPEPAAGATRVREKDAAVMVYVPLGWFLMGSMDDDPDALDHEKPQHEVWLDGYWIDRTEVTNGQYARFIADGGYSEQEYWTDNGWTWKETTRLAQPPSWDKWFSEPDRPVVDVTWYEADAYARWAGGRLPTEAEWEKAARGTDARVYPWGDEWDQSKANTTENQAAGATKVGSFADGASPYGALDMAGNVGEWVADSYDREYYSGSPERNPQGPDSGGYRMVRGGSFCYGRRPARCAYRHRAMPAVRAICLGFRVVVSPI